MQSQLSTFVTRLASSPEDLRAAQRLRYDVFVAELGSDGPDVDHENRLETDKFDRHFDHLLLIDTAAGPDVLNGVVGVYRLLRQDRAKIIGQFYSEDEYDLSVLKDSGRKLLELGRSCLRSEYRGSAAMYHLWNGLADYVLLHEIEVLFGVASFHGIDPEQFSGPLSLLHHRHLAPEDLRVRARSEAFQPMDLIAKADLDAKSAMLATPALIKAYLRLGGFVGEGAFVDHAFNTTDVCLIMDTKRMNARQRQIYEKSGRA
ncbi:MAG: GNAT family N-acyltransferase [Paracoccaceae bacterium]|nr:GNAT family N-acyltransferase [Paracoccaceae bacterium]